jgi:hypothetical protein
MDPKNFFAELKRCAVKVTLVARIVLAALLTKKLMYPLNYEDRCSLSKHNRSMVQLGKTRLHRLNVRQRA